MAKMTVIYQSPADPAAFEAHYFNVNMPLAKQMPGLIKYEVNNGPNISPTGHSAYRIAHLYFEDMEAIKQAFASHIGQQCAADRRILAPNNEDVQIYLYDTTDV